MNPKDIKYEIQYILSGKKQISCGEPIQTIANYLRTSTKTIAVAKTDKHYKEKETKYLINYVAQNNQWIENIDFSLFISQGAKQRVYLKDHKRVIKLNDAI